MLQAISSIKLFGTQQVSKLQSTNAISENCSVKMHTEENKIVNLHTMAASINEAKQTTDPDLERKAQALIGTIDKYSKSKTLQKVAPHMSILKDIATGKINFPQNGRITKTVNTPLGKVTYDFRNDNNGQTIVTGVLAKTKKGNGRIFSKARVVSFRFNAELIKNLPGYYAKYHKN